MARKNNHRTTHWGERWGLNPRPQEPQSCALPTELRPPYSCPVIIPHVAPPTYAKGTNANENAPGRTRTCYPRFRRPMLCPDELQAQNQLDGFRFFANASRSDSISKLESNPGHRSRQEICAELILSRKSSAHTKETSATVNRPKQK